MPRFLLAISLLILSGCVPQFAVHYVISLEGKMINSVVDHGHLEIGSAHLLNRKIATKYEYTEGDFTLSATALPHNFPTILFRLKRKNGDSEELMITSNHPCYSHFGAGMNLDVDDSKQFIGFDPGNKNDEVALYKWTGFNPENPKTFSKGLSCNKDILPSDMRISIAGLGNEFKISIPIKVHKAGFYMYFDGV